MDPAKKNPENLPDTPKDREQVFIENLATAKSVSEAGRIAGYSEAYIKGDFYKKFNSKRFIQRVRDHYNGFSYTLLPKIAQAESKVVDLILEDPEKLPKFERTLKQIKQATGILKPEEQPGQPMISVQNIQNILLNVHDRAENTEDILNITPE